MKNLALVSAAALLVAAPALADTQDLGYTETESCTLTLPGGAETLTNGYTAISEIDIDINCNNQFDLTFSDDDEVGNTNTNIEFDGDDFFNSFTVDAAVKAGELATNVNDGGEYDAVIDNAVTIEITPTAAAGKTPVAGAYTGTVTVTLAAKSPTAPTP